MPHPFMDKLFVFIGVPAKCSRREMRDALVAVGGVPDENITAFVNYVVVCNGAEKTQKYKKALEYEVFFHILSEEQFFDILEGRAEPPPEKPKIADGVTVIPGKDPEAHARLEEQAMNNILNRKRLNNMAKHGVPTPDGGRVKADLRQLDKVHRVAELMKNDPGHLAYSIGDSYDRCDKCGNPAKVHYGDGKGGEVANLCLDCHNRMMANLTGADMADIVPKRLAFKSRGGKTHEFDIEFLVFPRGKRLTATEVGKTKRMVGVNGSLDDDFDKMLETLKKRIKKSLAVTYMRKDGYVKENKMVGYIGYNDEDEEHEVIIDGKPYTWEHLKKHLSMHEGWQIKIEFGDIGGDLDAEG